MVEDQTRMIHSVNSNQKSEIIRTSQKIRWFGDLELYSKKQLR